jgi:hypothetical protein
METVAIVLSFQLPASSCQPKPSDLKSLALIGKAGSYELEAGNWKLGTGSWL